MPTMAVAHFRVGVAEFELENYEAAVRAFAEGLKASPGSCDLRRARDAALVALRARPGRLEALHAAQRRREREANEMVMLKINKLTAAKPRAPHQGEGAAGRARGHRVSSHRRGDTTTFYVGPSGTGDLPARRSEISAGP